MRITHWSAGLLPLLLSGLVAAQSMSGQNDPKAPNIKNAPMAPRAAAPEAAASAPANTVRPEVVKPLVEAQTLIADKKYAQAKEKLAAATAVPNRTPFESYHIARMTLAMSVGADDAAGSESALNQVLELSKDQTWLKPEDTLPLIQNVAIVNYRVKNYLPAAAWFERYMKAGGTDAQVRALRINALYLGGNYPAAAAAAEEELAPALKNGKVPEQNLLEILAQSRDKQKDGPGFIQAMDMLVQYYPKKEYWQTVVIRLWLKTDLATRLQLDVFRLAAQVDALPETNDYVEYMEMAQKAGYSAEALKIYDRGVAAGLVGKGADAAAHAKLRAKLVQEAEQDRKNANTEAANAAKKPDGNTMLRVGMNLVGLDMADKGIDLMEKGIAKGGLKRPQEAWLELGIAYAKTGQNDKAAQAFAKVSGKEGLDELGRYWTWAIRKP